MKLSWQNYKCQVSQGRSQSVHLDLQIFSLLQIFKKKIIIHFESKGHHSQRPHVKWYQRANRTNSFQQITPPSLADLMQEKCSHQWMSLPQAGPSIRKSRPWCLGGKSPEMENHCSRIRLPGSRLYPSSLKDCTCPVRNEHEDKKKVGRQLFNPTTPQSSDDTATPQAPTVWDALTMPPQILTFHYICNYVSLRQWVNNAITLHYCDHFSATLRP